MSTSSLSHEISSNIVQDALAYLLSRPAIAVTTSLLILLVVLFRRRYPCLSLSTLEKSFNRLEDAIQMYKEECPPHYYSTFHEKWLKIKGDFSSLKSAHHGHWDPVWTLGYWKLRMDHVRKMVACYERCEDMHKALQRAIEFYRQQQDSLHLDVYNNPLAYTV
ncbi:hypothetical protein D9758_003042 [Tetrapyrgos nigripes]|uniref:Uncharacterized protein n=1 Tax=Tetrapyrgos nigripes TaxID=182062 RepID=A0A8H5LTL3_9AGAR|nr:hypothetical protein D9758_003043 [Tetrapyrgos nigripes]KAF5368946.1 hypothetical protein D9758_003042 [Tetrapyrgos nigripes]